MKRIRYLSVVLTLLMIFAFAPAAVHADGISIEKQEVLKDGVSVMVTLSTSEFEVDAIEPVQGEDYFLKSDEYKVSGNTITFPKKFLTGGTGYYPSDVKRSFRIHFKDGTTLETKYMKLYCIKGMAYTAIPSFVYDGKQKTLKDIGMNDNLKKDRDYKIVYEKSKRKAIGVYKFTVKGIGKYNGTIHDQFKIIPKKPKIASAKRTKSTATVKWKKVKNCSGYVVTLWEYHVDYETDDPAGGYYTVYKKSFVKGKNKTTKKFTSVKKSKYDMVTVAAYKVVDGKKIYSNKRKKSF